MQTTHYEIEHRPSGTKWLRYDAEFATKKEAAEFIESMTEWNWEKQIIRVKQTRTVVSVRTA